jgi:hypothetical protein
MLEISKILFFFEVKLKAALWSLKPSYQQEYGSKAAAKFSQRKIVSINPVAQLEAPDDSFPLPSYISFNQNIAPVEQEGRIQYIANLSKERQNLKLFSVKCHNLNYDLEGKKTASEREFASTVRRFKVRKSLAVLFL